MIAYHVGVITYLILPGVVIFIFAFGIPFLQVELV